MLQLAVGVVDAVPPDRRADMAEEPLLFLAGKHRFSGLAAGWERRTNRHSLGERVALDS